MKKILEFVKLRQRQVKLDMEIYSTASDYVEAHILLAVLDELERLESFVDACISSN